MQGTALARAALEEIARPPRGDGGERARLRKLVTERLAGSELGAMALARLEDSPGEDADAVARVVLAEAVHADAAFASELRETLVRVLGERALTAAPSVPPRPDFAPAVDRPPAPALPGYVPLLVRPPVLQEAPRRPSVWWVIWLGLPQSLVLLYVVVAIPGFVGEEYAWPALSMFSAAVGVVLAVVGLARRPVQGMPMTGLTVGLLLDAGLAVFWLLVLTGRIDINDVVDGINSMSW